jgi:hypothetical protein
MAPDPDYARVPQHFIIPGSCWPGTVPQGMPFVRLDGRPTRQYKADNCLASVPEGLGICVAPSPTRDGYPTMLDPLSTVEARVLSVQPDLKARLAHMNLAVKRRFVVDVLRAETGDLVTTPVEQGQIRVTVVCEHAANGRGHRGGHVEGLLEQAKDLVELALIIAERPCPCGGRLAVTSTPADVEPTLLCVDCRQPIVAGQREGNSGHDGPVCGECTDAEAFSRELGSWQLPGKGG